jgi:hypothetical protein
MTFKYSCFISYANNEGCLTSKLIDDLYQALSDELGVLLRDEKIFVDKERLRGGDYINESLASIICESVCMIMVYTPTYFHRDHLYCAKEFKAMQLIEKRRLKLLENKANVTYGLIIPIILRGETVCPKGIIGNRIYYNFENYLHGSGRTNILRTNKIYALCIKNIAQVIYERYDLFSGLWDPKIKCKNFKLPNDAQVETLLKKTGVYRQNFPGHG